MENGQSKMEKTYYVQTIHYSFTIFKEAIMIEMISQERGTRCTSSVE